MTLPSPGPASIAAPPHLDVLDVDPALPPGATAAYLPASRRRVHVDADCPYLALADGISVVPLARVIARPALADRRCRHCTAPVEILSVVAHEHDEPVHIDGFRTTTLRQFEAVTGP